jgi:mRNA interferase HicA
LNAATNRRSAIPRHAEINDHLARKICRDLGVPEPGHHD